MDETYPELWGKTAFDLAVIALKTEIVAAARDFSIGILSHSVVKKNKRQVRKLNRQIIRAQTKVFLLNATEVPFYVLCFFFLFFFQYPRFSLH